MNNFWQVLLPRGSCPVGIKCVSSKKSIDVSPDMSLNPYDLTNGIKAPDLCES